MANITNMKMKIGRLTKRMNYLENKVKFLENKTKKQEKALTRIKGDVYSFIK